MIAKISRFTQNDEEDIQNIIKVDKKKVYERANDAINVGVRFREEWVRMNLDEVMEMFDG